MTLYEKLNQSASYNGKYTYAQLVNKLIEAAKDGKFSIDIDSDEIVESDIEKLKKENIEAEFVKGDGFNYWEISWY